MRIKEFLIFCTIVGIFIITFLALTTTLILPQTVIPIFDGFTISTIFVIIIVYIILTNLYKTKRMNEQIKLRNSQLETIINNIDLTLILRDLDGNILTMNNTKEFLGYTSEEMVGKNIRDIFKNLDEVIDNADEEIIKTKKYLQYKNYLVSKKGIGKHIKIGKYPILDKKGNVSKIIVCYADDTLEQQIEKTKNDFIETLTHDLRTPTLSQIKALDLLLNGSFGELDENKKEILTQIKNSCLYMNDLIFTILDTYVMENGNIKLNITNLDIPSMLREILQELKWQTLEKNKRIKLNIDDNAKYISGDKLQLRRVVINLVSNAIKYSKDNTTIEVNVEEIENNYIDFQVKNTTSFLTQKDLENIFDKYKSKSNSKIIKISTGLGLYLSKQVIDKHNGEIYAKCIDEETFAFGFKIPKIYKSN